MAHLCFGDGGPSIFNFLAINNEYDFSHLFFSRTCDNEIFLQKWIQKRFPKVQRRKMPTEDIMMFSNSGVQQLNMSGTKQESISRSLSNTGKALPGILS